MTIAYWDRLLTKQSALPAQVRETLVEAVEQGKTMTITWKLPQEAIGGLGFAIAFYAKGYNEQVRYTKWYSSFKQAEEDKTQEGIYQVTRALPTLKDPAAVGVRIIKGYFWSLRYEGELQILDVSIDGHRILPPPALPTEKVSQAPIGGWAYVSTWP